MKRNYKFSILILLLLAFSYQSYSQDMFGRVKGPAAKEVMAFDETSDNVLFAATWGDGIYRTDDAGASWEQVNTDLTNLYVRSILCASNGNIYAGTDGGGIYISDDNGDTWVQTNDGLTNLEVTIINEDANGNLYAGTHGSGVFKSDDDGTTWVNFGNGLKYRDVTDIEFGEGTIVLVSTWGGGFYKTDDDGVTWKRANSQLYNLFIHNMTKNSVGEIFASTNGRGIVMSIDDGLSWIEYDTTIVDPNTTAVEVNSQGSLVVGMRTSGLVYIDESWGPDFRNSNIRTNGTNAIFRAEDGTLYAAMPLSGVMKSTDDGERWTGSGLSESSIRYSIFSQSSDLIFATGRYNNLMRSLDYGETFTDIESLDIGVTKIRFTDNYIYAATEEGLIRSDDGGEYWVSFGPDIPINDFAVSDDDHFLISYADIEAEPPEFFLFRTTDGFATIDTPLVYHTDILPVEGSPDGIFYANMVNSWLVFSTDNLQTLRNENRPLMFSNEYEITSSTDVYFVNNEGLQFSTDNGNSFTLDDLGMTYPNTNDLEFDQNGNFLCSSSSKGLFYSTDGRTSWQDYNDNITLSKITALEVTDENDIFFSVASVFRSVDSNNIGTPLLLLPTNLQGAMPVHPDFAWKPCENADLYEFQLSFNETFTGVVETVILSDTTWTSYRELENNKTYWWKVRAKNHSNYGPWSMVFRFATVIAPPILESPSDEKRGVPVDPIFIWHPVDAALTYTLQLSDEKDFSNIMYNIADINDTTFQIKGLENLETYYWRLKAFNSETNSLWSEEWEFFTVLPTPELKAPLDKSKDLYPILTFEWYEVEAGEKYYIQIAKNEAFDLVIFESETENSTSHFLELLEYNTQYWWRIRASNTDGTGMWSEPWSFLTAIQEPILMSPQSGLVDEKLNMKLFWAKYNGAESYHLQIAYDDNFKEIFHENLQVDTTEYNVPELDYYTKYYWRVRVNIDDRQSYWSETWNFRTLMETTSLLSPEDQSDDNGVYVKFLWNDIKGAKYYHLQITEGDNFAELFYEKDSIVITEHHVNIFNILSNYQWRVRAYNETSDSPWSEVWSFSTIDTANSVEQEIFGNTIKYYPNPVSSDLTISFELNTDQFVDISIVNIEGKVLSRLHSGVLGAGSSNFFWEPKSISEGTYFIWIKTNRGDVIKPIIHIK